MRITPTPRAISPQDIVRIYVPAAPPDELAVAAISNNDRSATKESKMNRSRSSSQTSIRVLNGGVKMSPSNAITTIVGIPLGNRESNRNSIIFGSGDITPVRQRFNDDDLIQSFGEASMTSLGNISNSGQRSTSSSRRGSLSRKSPSTMFDSGLMECSHITKRRLSTASNSENRYRMGIGSSENISTSGSGSGIRPTVSTISIKSNDGENSERKKIMTSFEQLAARQRRESSDALNRNSDSNDGIDKYSPDDDENYSYSYYSIEKTPNSSGGAGVGGSSGGNGSGAASDKAKTKYVSESNIQYKAFQSSVDSNLDYKANKRRPISSANETTPFHYDPFTVPETTKVLPPQSLAKSPGSGRIASASTTTTTITKEYTRFYGTSVDEDEDDAEPKESDESSSSPNSKSILNTPVNETIPLLLSSPMTVEPRTRNDSYSDAMQSPTRVPIGLSPTSSRIATSRLPSTQPYKESSSTSAHVPVSLHYKSPVRSPISATTPTSSSVSPATPPTPNHARPSRIPLLHSTHKSLSPTSPQSINNDLNSVLPPVEIISQSAQRIQKLVSPTGSGHYRVDTRYEYDGVKRVSKAQQNNGSAGNGAGGANTNNDLNTIRIKVNQNQRN